MPTRYNKDIFDASARSMNVDRIAETISNFIPNE